MKANAYTITYAAVLATVCALLLAATGEITAPYRAANAKADRIRNILAVLDIPGREQASTEELLSIFEEKVREIERDGLSIYILEGSGATAVPFSGPGLWGPIKGFLALEPDGVTIRGISFYEQEETPGLGGEIATDWFRRQFVGKKIVSASGNPGLEIVTGKAEAQNEVHAISGATMTCDKVETMLNKTVRSITATR